jgi:hypothetical protein
VVCEVDVVDVRYTEMDWLRFAGLEFSFSETSGTGLIGGNSFWIFYLVVLACIRSGRWDAQTAF